ncbi:MAG: hypothetical protein ACYS0K_15830 [Planctomycetota bacterium]
MRFLLGGDRLVAGTGLLQRLSHRLTAPGTVQPTGHGGRPLDLGREQVALRLGKDATVPSSQAAVGKRKC